MKQVSKSVLLWYSPREMYELVTRVEAYPQFLPWCDSAHVVERHEDGVTVGAGMVFVSSGYTSFGETPGNVLIAYKPKK